VYTRLIGEPDPDPDRLPANRIEDYPPFRFLRERATTSPSIWEVWGDDGAFCIP